MLTSLSGFLLPLILSFFLQRFVWSALIWTLFLHVYYLVLIPFTITQLFLLLLMGWYLCLLGFILTKTLWRNGYLISYNPHGALNLKTVAFILFYGLAIVSWDFWIDSLILKGIAIILTHSLFIVGGYYALRCEPIDLCGKSKSMKAIADKLFFNIALLTSWVFAFYFVRNFALETVMYWVYWSVCLVILTLHVILIVLIALSRKRSNKN